MKKNPSTTKTKIKKKDFKSFSIWLQCHTEGCHGAWGTKLCAFTRKKNDFFLFQVLYLPHIKNSNDSSNADDFMFKKKKFFFSVFKKKNCTDFFVWINMSSMKNV